MIIQYQDPEIHMIQDNDILYDVQRESLRTTNGVFMDYDNYDEGISKILFSDGTSDEVLGSKFTGYVLIRKVDIDI